MKKLMLIIAALVLVAMPLPASAQGSGELPELTEEVYISEVFVGTEKYIELYFNEDVIASDYFIMTTSNAGTMSTGYSLGNIDVSAGTYYIVDSDNVTSRSGLSLTNPVGFRTVWLCRGNQTSDKQNCYDKKSENFIDQFAYNRLDSDQETASWSRDFVAYLSGLTTELTIKKSHKTPGLENSFPAAQSDPGGTEPPDASPHCAALQLSEISTNEQWIELYNDSDQTIQSDDLADCVLAVQYGDKTPPDMSRYKIGLDQYLDADVIEPYSYTVIDVGATAGLSLPKSVTNRLILIHDAGSDYASAVYSTAKTNTSLAYFADGWKVTFAPTKGTENIYQQYQTCEEGKRINEKTGNCVKDPDPPAECAEGQFRNPATGRCKKYDTDKTLADCAEGQFRNPLTNRCKKIASDKGLAECPEGQFRNPLTNRCKKIATADDKLKPCAEGWERNPETNRCRKKVSTEPAAFAVQPGDPTGGSLTALLASVGVVLLTTIVVLFQFRMEIANLMRRLMPKRVKIGATSE
ncbi:lamin tail domain-containing protein [Candidatus Saccharibacteria bacterium]|nr:lamin tail domain-containing protein [Candidatus Saccharibacteria bacterium]